jgi:hypothetical protein
MAWQLLGFITNVKINKPYRTVRFSTVRYGFMFFLYVKAFGYGLAAAWIYNKCKN